MKSNLRVRLSRSGPAFRPEADLESVRAAARALSAAQRPVIVAGGGVTSSGAQQEVVELAEMLNIPVATSLNAKGAIPDNHPLAVGVVGSYSRWCANRVVQRGRPSVLHRQPHRQPGNQRVEGAVSPALR